MLEYNSSKINSYMDRFGGCGIRAILDTSDSSKSPKYLTKKEADETYAKKEDIKEGLTKEETDKLYEPKLPNGNTGQVLTKTETGVEWQDSKGGGEVDLSNYYTKEEIDNKLNWFEA